MRSIKADVPGRAESSSAMTGLAGVARVDITPPIGTPLLGFKGRGPANGVADPLTATALVLCPAGGPAAPAVAIVACDLVGMDDLWVRKVEERAREAAGLSDLRVLICCSHTHYGPAGPTMDAEGELTDPRAKAYAELLVHDLAGCIALAASRRRAAGLKVTAGRCGVGINRRERTPAGDIVLGNNPSGPCDDRVLVVAVQEEHGQLLATLVNFACHPVVLDHDFRSISSDFVSPLRETVERYAGGACLFVQGAAGDINPRVMCRGPLGPLETALPLASEVIRILSGLLADSNPAQPIRIAAAGVETGYRPAGFESADEATREVTRLRGELEALTSMHRPDRADVEWAELRLQRAEESLAILTGEGQEELVAASHSAVMLTDKIAVATVPCELFNELGQAIVERSPFEHTLMAAYTNGYIGYVPTAQAYREGGYEVTHGALVRRGSGEAMVDLSVELLGRLRQSAVR